MKYCFNCGNEVSEGTKFCSFCGTKLIIKEQEEKTAKDVLENEENKENTGAQTEEASNIIEQENSEKTTRDEVFFEEKKKPSLKNSILSMVFGAIGADFAICTFIPFVFWMFLIPALIFKSISKKKYDEYIAEGGESNGFMKASHALRKATNIALIPCLIISAIYTIVIIALIVEANLHI